MFNYAENSAENYEIAAKNPDASSVQAAAATGRRLIGRAALAFGLSVPALVSSFAAEELSGNTPAAEAATDTYPDSSATDCSTVYGVYSWCKGNPPSPYSPRGYAYRNCTDFAAYRTAELTGIGIPRNLGNAKDWDNNAPGTWKIDTAPEPGDIAQSEAGDFGHVGVVENVSKNSQGGITAITVSEYNAAGNGKYTSLSYSPDASGVFWRDGAKTKRWDRFLDVNGTGKGINNTTQPASGASTGRLMLINGAGAGYSKDELSPGGWHPLTANGDIAGMSASGTQMAIINGTGEAWGADISAVNLANNTPGLQPLHVPKDPSSTGGVREIAVDQRGNMIAINNCGAAYGWRNVPGGQRWVPMTNCGDALDVEIGNGRLALINGCGGAYVSDSGYDWSPLLNCGDARAVAVSESGKVAAINSTGTAFIRNQFDGTWVPKSAAGDAQKLAFGNNRLMIITSGGAAWAADVGQNLNAPMTQLTANGDATAITVGAQDRMGIINAAGAAYASDTMVQGGAWTPQSSNGDARAFIVG